MGTNRPPLATVDLAAALCSTVLPDGLISTRASDRMEWQSGALRSPVHLQWLVSSTDSYGRPVKSIIDHDIVVDVGGVRLSASHLRPDALTRRIVTLAVMNKVTLNSRDVRGLQSLLYDLDWLTRWRLDRGIGCNADFEQRHVIGFLRSIREAPSVAYLVPIRRRIALLANSDAGQMDTDHHAAGARRSAFDGERFAALLGITANALMSDGLLRSEIMRSLGASVAGATEGGRKGSSQSLSVRRVQQLLRSWQVLADLSTRGLLSHDPLGFSPFDGIGGSIGTVAARFGVDRNRLTIAPPYFLSILDAASRWVIDYAPHLLEALATMRDDPRLNATGGNAARERSDHRRESSLALDRTLPAGMPRLALGWRAEAVIAIGGDQPRISMKEAIGHLMTACMILVAGFGARSITDALQLRVGCLKEVQPGAWELALRLEEGVRDLDAMPVPRVVVRAVGVLTELTADTRAVTGNDLLFHFIRRPWAIGADAEALMTLSFPPHDWLAGFAAINGLPLLDPETQAPLQGGQLRLGYAVAYHHVMPGLPLEALTRALGRYGGILDYLNGRLPGAAGKVAELIRAREAMHRDAAGQAAAIELEDLLKDLRSRGDRFEAIRCESALRRLQGIVNGTDLPGGLGGERLVLEVRGVVDQVRRSVRVLGRNHPKAESEEVLDVLWAFARSHRIDVVPGRFAHCTFVSGSEARCRCRTREAMPWSGLPLSDAASDGPDYDHAGMVPCLGCDFGAAFASDRTSIDAECTRLEGVGGRAETPAAHQARQDRLAELRAVRARAMPSGKGVR